MAQPPQDPFALNQCTEIPRAAVNRRGLCGLNSLGVNGRLVEMLNRCPGIYDSIVFEHACPSPGVRPKIVVEEEIRGRVQSDCGTCP